MNALEEWLQDILKQPIEILDNKYSDAQDVQNELETFPLPKKGGYTVSASDVNTAALRRLHNKLRGYPCEEAIWAAVLWYLARPIPKRIAHDLIDRSISMAMMVMTRQVDEVQWRLATISEDALYTLIRERYAEPRYSVAQFKDILQQYALTGVYNGILYMLTYYETPSSQKKVVLLVAIAENKRNWRKEKYLKKRIKKFVRE